MNGILAATLMVGGTGLLIGILIGIAGRRFVAVTVPCAGSVSVLAALARHCQRQDCADREQQTENPQKFLFLHRDSSFLLFSFSWFC